MDKNYSTVTKMENPIRKAMLITPHERVVLFEKEVKMKNRRIFSKFTKDGADLQECPVWFKNLAEKYLILEEKIFEMEYYKELKLRSSMAIIKELGLVKVNNRKAR